MHNVCNHLTHRAELPPDWTESLSYNFPSFKKKKHTEGSLWEQFSHPTPRKKPCAPRCTFEFFEKRCLTQRGVPAERRNASRPRPRRIIQDGGWKTSSAPNIMSPSVPSAIHSHTAPRSWLLIGREWPASTLDRCQMDAEGGLIGWLSVFTLAALVRLTVSTADLQGISSRSNSSIPNNAT